MFDAHIETDMVSLDEHGPFTHRKARDHVFANQVTDVIERARELEEEILY